MYVMKVKKEGNRKKEEGRKEGRKEENKSTGSSRYATVRYAESNRYPHVVRVLLS